VKELRDRIFKAAESVTSEMAASSWPETEHRPDVSRATDGAHIDVY